MLRIPKLRVQFYIFFAVVWVFYSLNSRYFQIPKAPIVRWVLLGILIVVSMRGRRYVPTPPRMAVAIVVAALPSFFASVDLTESVVKMLSFIVVVYGFYIVFASLDTKEDFETVLKIAMVVMIAFEIQSILTIVMGYGYGSGGSRATGITTNANTLGDYSNLALLASYYWMVRSKGIKKAFFIALMGCCAWTCILSGSRGGFAVLTMLTFLMLLSRMKKTATRIAVILLAVGFLYVMFSGRLAFLGIAALNNLVAKGGTSRGEIWEYGMSLWRYFPIFGCGYQTSNLWNTMTGVEGYDFHNSYITILAETGVWGVSILGLTAFENFFNAIPVLKFEMEEQQINPFLMSLLMMATQLVAAYGESFLFAVGSTEACIFWMLFTWNVAYQQFVRGSFTEEVIEDNEKE